MSLWLIVALVLGVIFLFQTIPLILQLIEVVIFEVALPIICSKEFWLLAIILLLILLII